MKMWLQLTCESQRELTLMFRSIATASICLCLFALHPVCYPVCLLFESCLNIFQKEVKIKAFTPGWFREVLVRSLTAFDILKNCTITQQLMCFTVRAAVCRWDGWIGFNFSVSPHSSQKFCYFQWEQLSARQWMTLIHVHSSNCEYFPCLAEIWHLYLI